jgi:hypothetical protein
MHMSLDGLGWHRPKPQLLQPTASEWKWLPAGPCMGLLLDSTMSIQDSRAQVGQPDSCADLHAAMERAVEQGCASACLDHAPKVGAAGPVVLCMSVSACRWCVTWCARR